MPEAVGQGEGTGADEDGAEVYYVWDGETKEAEAEQ